MAQALLQPKEGQGIKGATLRQRIEQQKLSRTSAKKHRRWTCGGPKGSRRKDGRSTHYL